jgi:hypothetical protein
MSDLASHERIFTVLNYDFMLNEFLWRSDPSIGVLQYQVTQLLQSNYYNNIKAFTNITSGGVFINVFQNSNKLWHMSFHLHHQPQLATKLPGAIHIPSTF